jgi:hypothetical protein
VLLADAVNYNQLADDYAIYGEFHSNQAKCVNTSSDGFNLRCFGFATWSKVKAAVNDTNKVVLAQVTELDLRPSESIVLTGELDLLKVCEILCKNNNLDPCSNLLQVYLAGVKGVDVANKWNTISSSELYLTLVSSTLAFFYMGSGPGQYQCDEKTMRGNLTAAGSFFNNFYMILFENTVTYDQKNPVCPFIFTNAYLKYFSLYGLMDSFLVLNLFKSQKVNFSSSTINSSIANLNLKGYNYALDESLLHRLVFERLQILTLYEMVGSIQPDLFKASFEQLTDIEIQVASLANFLHKVGLEWTGHFSNINNSNIWISFSEKMFVNEASWLSPGFGYTFPSRDLCIFARFSFLQTKQRYTNGSFALVVPLLSTNLSACTDSIAWLTHNYIKYDLLNDYHLYFGSYPLNAYQICWNKSSVTIDLPAIQTKINQCSSLWNDSFKSTN